MNPGAAVMRCRRFWFLVCGVVLAWSGAVRAGGSAFSADGKTVYVPKSEPSGALDRIDAASGTVTPVTVRLGKEDVIAGITLTETGELYLATKNALWRWTPGEPGAKWVEAAPKGIAFEDVACNVKTGEVLLVGNGSRLFHKRSRSAAASEVGIRYPPGNDLNSPAYLPDGSLLFSADGDVWHGRIEYEVEDPHAKKPYVRASLVAYRYAPLAKRETYDGTPTQTGVRALAVSRTKVYVSLQRMGGSGWGSILRLDLPEQDAKGGLSYQNGIDAMAKTMGSVTEQGLTSGGDIRLCGSPDGRLVSYWNGRHELLSDHDKFAPVKSQKLFYNGGTK